MKVGDLVKFKGDIPDLVGLIVEIDTFLFLEKAAVKWNRPRDHSYPGNVVWEYLDEIEIVNES